MTTPKLDLSKILRERQISSPKDKTANVKMFKNLVDFFDDSSPQKIPPKEFSYLLLGFSQEEKLFLLEISKVFLNMSEKYQSIFETSLPATDAMKEVALEYKVHLVEGQIRRYLSISKGLFD